MVRTKVMHAALAVLAVLLVSLGARAQTGPTPNWKIDPSHSLASFSVTHMGLSHVRGQFTKLTGDGYWDGSNNYKNAMLEAVIDTSSIDTREPKRDAHLKSADFFDAVKYPTITFKSRSIRDRGNGKVQIVGDLTIHGVTKGVVLTGSVTKPIKDPFGSTRMGANASTTVNRKDFGLLWNKTLDNGSTMVGDDVDITLDVEMVQAQ